MRLSNDDFMLNQRILLEHHDTGFSLQATVESHGWWQLPPFGYSDGILTRVHRMADGRVVKMYIEQTGNTSRADFLLLQTDGPAYTRDQFEIAGTVRRMLCMDWDLAEFYTLLERLPDYAWVAANSIGRMLRAPTVWEDLAKTLLTTNTTWAQTINMSTRLVTLGDESPFGHAFPTPAQVAALSVDDLTAHVGAGYRGPHLHKLATQIADGELDVEAWALSDWDSDALYKAITALDGFGPYAAGSILRLLGHHNYLSVDTVARDAHGRWHNGGERAPEADLKAHYAQYGAWQGLMQWMDVLRRDDG